MDGIQAIYLGRLVEKEGFRTFIYGADGTKRLVESWDDFEMKMQTGIWFASASDIPKAICVDEEVKCHDKSKSNRVKKDDFLPKG